jgi:subtilisin-like proprotein convertase family protein
MFGASSDPTYAEIAGKLLDADRVLNNAAHASAICTAFTARLILNSDNCDASPHGEVTLFQSSQQGLAIPDNSQTGIASTLDLADSRSIGALFVNVNITHPSRGDLQIVLTGPDGTMAILQNPSADRSPAAQVTYGVDADPAERLDVFNGRSANGRWTLTVRDLQSQNIGTLISWSLGITFAGDVSATIRPASFAPRKHIAAVAHTPGALGTSWQTDVRLFNGGAATANVTAIFTHAGEEGWNHFAAVKLSIAPKQLMALDDIVAATMRTSGLGQLEFLGDTDALVVTSRTYTHAKGGTYGQFIPAVTTLDASTIAYVPQVQATADFRTNVGFAEVSGNSGTVRVTLFDAATGAVVSQNDVPFVPFDQVQFPASGAALMTAQLSVVSGDGRIVAYGSVIDNHSGDPIYVAATTPIPGAFVAPVISQAGVNTFWRSDVFLTAPSDSGGSFDLTYLDAVTGERLVKHGTVAGRQAIRLSDVIGSYFGRPSGFGTVRADFSGNLVGTSRTFTSSSNGTYGQFIPMIQGSDAGVSRELLHIERSPAFRTNLGAINTSDGAEVIRFTLYDSGGQAIGSTDRTVAPLGVVQFPVDVLTSSSLIDGRVEVRVVAGSGEAVAWASVIDNVTGDPIFVQAQ